MADMSGMAPKRPEAEFSESLPAWVKRQVLGLAYMAVPSRVANAPALTLETLYRLVVPGPRIPDETSIWRTPDGYGGPVHDASPEGLLAGMRAGFHPLSHIGPLKWWAPSRRAVMMLNHVRVPRRFRRSMRTSPFTVTIDEAFGDVVAACAAPRSRVHLTWLYPETRKRLMGLFDLGYAHSVEVRDETGALVGGVFGVCTGPVFSALSMFHTANDASKLAIISLYQHLGAWGAIAVDHQRMGAWVEDLGATLIPRAEFNAMLTRPAGDYSKPGRWTVQFTTAETADWQPPGAVPGASRDAA
jgi:leucyl/phenylalanyl-tRNA--protein transferase